MTLSATTNNFKLRRPQSAVKPDPTTVFNSSSDLRPQRIGIVSASPFQEDPPDESVEAGR